MIHCLNDSGKPITILDLCGYSEQEAADMLVALRAEMVSNTEKWSLDNVGLNWPGVRVIIEHPRLYGSTERHPLEDPREHHHGLHPDFGLQTCWCGCVKDMIGPFKGVTRLMYIVRPDEDFEPAKELLECSTSVLDKIPIVGMFVEVVRLIAADSALTREEIS